MAIPEIGSIRNGETGQEFDTNAWSQAIMDYQDRHGIRKVIKSPSPEEAQNDLFQAYLVSDGDPYTYNEIMTGQDSEKDAIEKWAEENGYKVSSDTLDYLYNQFFTEKNNETAWQRTLEADNTKYQRAVADLKAAGLNPFLAMNGGISSNSAQTGSVGSGSIASSQNAKRSQTTSVMQTLLGVMGLLGAALVRVMAK